MKLTFEPVKDFEAAKKYVAYVVDDALNGRELGADPYAIITEQSVLVGWQRGTDPMFVAVNSYLGGSLPNSEAEELAIDYLKEIKWFADCDQENLADFILRLS